MTALFSDPKDLSELLLTASILEKTNAAVAQKAEALRRDLGEMKALQSEAATRNVRTQGETANLTREQAELARALSARQKLQASLALDHQRAEDQVAALSRESESLQELIGKLDARARTREIRPMPAPKHAVASKGNLSMPVAGEILHRFGERKSAGDTYRGLVIRARPGATVIAPGGGEVVFIGPFRDYGNMLLIKHTNGYISLIAGVGRLTASLNQTVNKGEPVAVMADARDQQAYVELRDSDAKPIDPADWFANVTGKMAQR